MKTRLLLLSMISAFASAVNAAAPVVTGLRASQRKNFIRLNKPVSKAIMKKILLTMALLGFSFQFLSAATMYVKDDVNLQSFNTANDNFNDAYYTVGVTIMPVIDYDTGAAGWLLEAEKLNPVIYLDDAAIAEGDIWGADAGFYAKEGTSTYDSTWVKMRVNPVPEAQYKGPPLFMDFQAWSATSTDYKGDDYQNGQVVLRFFPVLDMQKFYDQGGAIIESWYRKNDETNWTQFTTKVSGPNGHVFDEYELWGDLSDVYPVEITWDAKSDIPDFDGNISVRIRAKYGSAPFATNPAPYDGGSGGGGSTPSAQFVIDPADANGNAGYSFYDPDPFSADSATWADGITKRDSILTDAGMTSVGSYNDGVYSFAVYDFQGKESVRDQFVSGLTGRYYSINDTSLVAVQLSAGAN